MSEAEVKDLLERCSDMEVDMHRVKSIISMCSGNEKEALKCAKKVVSMMPNCSGSDVRLNYCLELLDGLVEISDAVRQFCGTKRVLKQIEIIAELPERARKMAQGVTLPEPRPDSSIIHAMMCMRRWPGKFGAQFSLYATAAQDWAKKGVPLPLFDIEGPARIEIFGDSLKVPGLTPEAENIIVRAKRVVQTMDGAPYQWDNLSPKEKNETISEAVDLHKQLGSMVHAVLSTGMTGNLTVVKHGTKQSDCERIVEILLETSDAIDSALQSVRNSEHHAAAAAAAAVPATAPPEPSSGSAEFFFDGDANWSQPNAQQFIPSAPPSSGLYPNLFDSLTSADSSAIL